MSVKLFVTDLDGTLLPNGRIVSPGNIKAVQAAVKAWRHGYHCYRTDVSGGAACS
jgi:hydroxymethylpyrimidine pyrophosphatase-like HAD family hydrolase